MPLFTVFQLQTELPKITLCFLSRKKPNHQFIIYGLSGKLLSFSARSLWLTESKALLKTVANIRTALHLGSSRNLEILFWISNRKSVQLPPSLYFYRPLSMNLIHCFLQGSCNDRGYVDRPEVPSRHWNVNFWQWVDVCPFPRTRPLMRSERQIPEPNNNWSEDFRKSSLPKH